MHWLKTEAGCQIFWISNKFETLGERFVYENYHFVASIVNTNSVCKKQSKSNFPKSSSVAQTVNRILLVTVLGKQFCY